MGGCSCVGTRHDGRESMAAERDQSCDLSSAPGRNQPEPSSDAVQPVSGSENLPRVETPWWAEVLRFFSFWM